ncbi:MAG: type I-E CRISPR-associated protein Cas6/Cse3/CasE [Spirochaetaceae bacterium]|jgi:CRISPR system Cascade subunit CasE|nr:type I-E CRISPR-associated protein Cas6/Cse3/CasE [Spirochaetaceae bacterium]
MIASILKLSRADYKALKITDPYSIHRTVYSLFPQQAGQTRDFLFADKGGDFKHRLILILSKREPQNPEYGVIESKCIPESCIGFFFYCFTVRGNPVNRD